MIIGSNFKLYSRKFLDERQQCESLEKLNANEFGKLYPYGFEVFCVQEGKWYQNVSNNGTPIWTERKGNGVDDIISDKEILNNKTWSSEYIYGMQTDLEQLITDNEDYITEIEDRLIFIEGELTFLESFDGSYDSLTNKPSLDNYITKEELNNLEKIETSEIEPTEEDISIWIDISKNTEIDEIARINDDTVAGNTTWSSEKIDSIIRQQSEVASIASINNIPTKTSQLVNDSNFITNIPSEYITEEELNNMGYLTSEDISNLATKVELNAKADKNNIPTKTSQLVNDSNFISSIPSEYITEEELNNMGYLVSEDISDLATKVELNAKASINNIPTKTSQLVNDSNFITNIPSEYITEEELNNMGYLTSEDISNLATKVELNAKADKNNIPTKTSQLVNDSNFISSIPSEYITEEELNNMGYLTTSQMPTSLPANGGNADMVCGFSIWFGTQEQYDAIKTKNATTIYLIQYNGD